jgi:site-specific DNA-methyltransferase (cytosine-N4-specific)
MKQGMLFAQPETKKGYKSHIKKSSIILGSAENVLKSFADSYFQTCITSPPYWGLRDYGVKDQIGAEKTVDEYIEHLVKVFRQVKRTLKEDGTFWLNIGDAYTSGNRTWRAGDKKNPARAMTYRPPTPDGLKPKDLIGIPWKLAFALQNDGWYLRSDIIWNKPNCQPESVKDRPTRSHEYIFLLTKNEKYYYDYESIKDEATNGSRKNKRTVWNIKTEAFDGTHFATFPEALVLPCILAGSKEEDFILDPFFGSGTVGYVSARNSRKFVGIDINPEYIEIAKNRIGLNDSFIRKFA